jgi:flagellar basal body P-ring formation protein FlgA
MTFRRMNAMQACAATASLVLGLFASGLPALADMGTAVVPTQIIYPGEVISASRLEEVDVTNPNLSGGYARTVAEVTGMVSKRTLLPGRTITLAGLREPHAVTRGTPIRLTFTMGNMTISAGGVPLEDAAVGDVIRVRNTDSGMIVNGTVMADGTIQVMAK